MRNSRFKFFLIGQDELQREAVHLRDQVNQIFNHFENNEITNVEFVFLIIATYCDFRRPGQWWMKGQSPYNIDSVENDIVSTFLKNMSNRYFSSGIIWTDLSILSNSG